MPTPPTDAPADLVALPLAEWEVVEWGRVRHDRYQLVPGLTLLRLLAELRRLRAEAAATDLVTGPAGYDTGPHRPAE